MMNQFLGMGETGCINFPGPLLQSTLNWGSETNRNLFSHSFGGHKSAVKVLTGPCSVQSLWGGSFLAFPVSGGPRCPWLVATSLQPLPLWSHGVLCVSVFSSYKDPTHIGLGPP